MLFDIHCHLMAGVDDGADIPDESVRMLRLAASGRTGGIVCTPHCNIPGSYQNYYSPEFDRQIRILRHTAAEQGIPVRIYPGQEVFLAGDFPRLIREGKIVTLNRSVYMLCEFDPYESLSGICRKLERAAAEGCVPIVAHPERYLCVAEDASAADRIRAAGALLQLNKGSLKGAFGPDAQRVAHHLLSRRKADFVASDAHSPYMRTPFLADAHEMICELYSMEYSDFLLRDNPLRVIQNQKIYHY